MPHEVFVKKCDKCGEAVYGIFTSAFENALTLLFECPHCGQVWSEDKLLDPQAKTEPEKKTDGDNEGSGEN